MPECRICKRQINKDIDDWIMPSKNYYYHKKCYEDWKQSVPTTDEEYKAFIYDFISRDLKVSYDYHMIEAQIKKFLKENKYTMKGIFFTLKYFYEVKKGDWDKGHGGVGIVPFIYNEACAYWILKEQQSKGIVAQIEQQMKQATQRETKTIIKQKKNKKYKMNFDAIESMEDEE